MDAVGKAVANQIAQNEQLGFADDFDEQKFEQTGEIDLRILMAYRNTPRGVVDIRVSDLEVLKAIFNHVAVWIQVKDKKIQRPNGLKL